MLPAPDDGNLLIEKLPQFNFQVQATELKSGEMPNLISQ